MSIPTTFERDLEAALLDEMEQRAREEWAPGLLEQATEILRAYGDAHDYDVEPVIQTAEARVERREGRVTVRVEWPHPAAPFFQMGTSDHTVDGNDILSFVWENPPMWVREEFEQEGDGWRVFFHSVEVDGLPESRFVRDALHWLRREVA